MDVLALRPFVPAKDFGVSLAFYGALGFATGHRDAGIAILERDGFGFILQDYYVEAWAANCMVQLLVRDVDAWWSSLDLPACLAGFDVKTPIAPALQPWGMRVGYIFDPAGVLWHIAGESG